MAAPHAPTIAAHAPPLIDQQTTLEAAAALLPTLSIDELRAHSHHVKRLADASKSPPLEDAAHARRILATVITSGALLPVGSHSPHVSPAGVLTAYHTPFLTHCLQARDFAGALPVALTPLWEVAVRYTSATAGSADVLTYLYSAGCVLAANRLWARAAESFRCCYAAVPASAPSAIALAAYKKGTLCALLATPFEGKALAPGDVAITSRGGRGGGGRGGGGVLAALARHAVPYELLARAFSPSGDALAATHLELILSKFKNDFNRDGNKTLVDLVIHAAALRRVERLSKTHSRVGFEAISRAALLPVSLVPSLICALSTERNIGVALEPETETVRFWELSVVEREEAAAKDKALLLSRGGNALGSAARPLADTISLLLQSIEQVRREEENVCLAPHAARRLLHSVGAGVGGGSHRDRMGGSMMMMPRGGGGRGGGGGGAMMDEDDAELALALELSMQR